MLAQKKKFFYATKVFHTQPSIMSKMNRTQNSQAICVCAKQK